MTGADDAVAVPEAALRSALEFGVGIAAAGAKLRPPLAFPQALKPLLKLNRLDRQALKTARRAIVADAEFRQRLAAVATTDLVDEVGIVWLERPNGWEQRVVALLAEAKAEDEAASAEARLRRADKRREAAEQAAARANAQIVAHREAAAHEQLRRVQAEERADSFEAEVRRLRRDVARLESDLGTARGRLEAAEASSLQAELLAAELTSRLRDAEQMRDHVLAQRVADPLGQSASDPTLDGPRAAAALRQAAAATRELAAALAAAGDAIVGPAKPPAEPRPIRKRGPQRTPIPIPGGLYGDSVAVALHFLKAPNAVTIVDGYNVAKLAWPHLALVEQRECCIETLEDLVRRTGATVSVVFDGADVVGAHTPRRNLIRVQFSPAGVIADDVIRDEVSALPAMTPVVVVTNDQAVVKDVRAVGANVVSSTTLLQLAGRAPSSSETGSA